MKKLMMLAPLLALLLQGCAPLMGALLTGAAGGAPPQAPAAVTNITRSGLDFALNSFDAALYGFDFAMDLNKPAPGSPQAKAVAAAGRKVMSFLGAAEAARDIGNSSTYEEAFRKATEALTEFRSALGMNARVAGIAVDPGQRPPLTWKSRKAILDRADRAVTI